VYNDLIGFLLVLMWAGFAGLLGWRVLRAFWAAHCPRITTFGKVGTVALILVCAAAGADKTPALRAIASLITALQSGELLDPSGRIASAAQAAVVQQVASLADTIATDASNAVVDAQSQFDAAAFTLTNRTLRVAYIAADMPRAIPGIHTNHNIAATIQKTAQDGTTNLLAWIWFSEEPAVLPQVAFSYSVAAGVWVDLPAVTNSYPDTTYVNGVPCIEYRFELPAPVRGTVFRPEYDMTFGGPNPTEYLIVPSGGILIQTNGVDRLPFTGTYVYSASLSVTYRGGVAVSATYHGTNYTGVADL
jgi:hypothetical protein